MPSPTASAAGLTPEQHRAVQRCDLLRDLAPGLLDELVAAMRVSHLAPGTALFPAEEAGHRLWAVVEGRVGITTSGRERLLAVMEAGDTIGEVQVFDPRPWSFAATAMTPAVVASAERDDVLAWVGRHPAVSAHLLQRMARRLAVKSRAGQDVGADASVRVARAVLALAERYTRGGVVQHGLTQQQLADIVGLSRERVNKVLGDFCHRRWISVARGSLRVLDAEALEAHAEQLPVVPGVTPARARRVAAG